jgi:hypothetical protein
MGKLEVVNNLGHSIYKENSAKILVEFFTKKKITLTLKAYVRIF